MANVHLYQDVQTEVVLMIFLRLAEDVISMDSHLQMNRKKQITQELHTHMEGLFSFFIETLQKNTAKFRSLKVGQVSCSYKMKFLPLSQNSY